MKLMIASDIHGSARYCRELMDAYEKEKADRLLLLGDILYHGPRNDLPEDYAPKQVMAMLNEKKEEIFAVRGNCEAEVDQAVLEFPVLAEFALLPLESRMIYITHGHIFNRNHLPPLKTGDILLHGHTHVPACEESDGYIYMNPGSVSMPKNDTPRGYMILENKTFTWKTLEGKEYRIYTVS
ncbi:MAG: phosphodiesterase [Erysipelotrichaceae bacterium]|nr:phosphodiesterase [Erysipelotrichaceae bacterium]